MARQQSGLAIKPNSGIKSIKYLLEDLPQQRPYRLFWGPGGIQKYPPTVNVQTTTQLLAI